MNKYFISTNNGYIHTNDERMALMPFTIDEMIADPSVLDPLGLLKKNGLRFSSSRRMTKTIGNLENMYNAKDL
jgi:hypothetical protein